ncbi:hypothetical protein B0T18DRAFT_424585 [Schizothecium vesticola]|uniref:Uncharacterized protein n=1 Tax=Schizothecium vesticola TaxID=314040 RepID=A0AA40FAE4_9PEZI|nr:hypothetical protein B0T18DRAFT_424585 [Schizothecium vesticola]
MEHHPVLETSIPTTDCRNSAGYPVVQPQFHHSNPPEEEIEPLSGYCRSPPIEEATRPLSGYCSPHVDDYCTTPSVLDEPIHHQPCFSNSSTDTFGRPRSPSIPPEPPYLRGGQSPKWNTFARPGRSPGPSPEEPSYDAPFFATASDPSSTRSSQTLRPSGSGYFSTGPSPGGGYHGFTSDAQRRAESEARMFAAAGFSASMLEEAEMKQENPSLSVLQSNAWEVGSEEAAEIEKEHVERMGGEYVNTSFQV